MPVPANRRKQPRSTVLGSSQPSTKHGKRAGNILYGASCFASGVVCALILVVTQNSTITLSRRMMTLDSSIDASIWKVPKENDLMEAETQQPKQQSLAEAPMKPDPQQKVKIRTERPDLPPGFCRTTSTGYEVVMESLLGNIFEEEGFLEEGSVLDVGAQFGEMACHFASLAPSRKVHALDPSPAQCNKIYRKFAAKLPNLHVTNAGIGEKLGMGIAGPEFTGMKIGEEFKVETVDNLFFDKGEALAFAHIDVEGLELAALQGGRKTINASQPVFTTEVRVHRNPEYTRQLLNKINELGYDSYVIDEPCGWPHMDYRNLINFPRSRLHKLEFSDAFNLVMATEAIFRVNSNTIFDKVYPCCALGGECCPYNSTDDKMCHEIHCKDGGQSYGRGLP